MSILRTIDPYSALIELQISPGCEELIDELIDSLMADESIRMEEA